MTYLSSLVTGLAGPGLSTVQGNGAMKASIVLFDSRPGTRNFVPTVTGKYRRAVVGAGSNGGGGYEEDVATLTAGVSYPYTVGAAGVPGTSAGGTSSFNSVISATGGASSATGGVGSGGLVSSSGGVGSAGSGGASGHRFGNGGKGCPSATGGGGGWSQDGSVCVGGNAGVDGFGLGLVPGLGGVAIITTANAATPGSPGGYGAGGGATVSASVSTPAGIGGGSGTGSGACAGIGGGTASTSPGVAGNGCVIVELIG